MGFIRLIFASVFTEIYVRKLSNYVSNEIENFYNITTQTAS